MSCEQCSVKFNLLRWRRTCTDCRHDFCSQCIMRFKGSSERLQRCRRCRVFFSIPLDRQALMNLRVKDLLWYLNSRRSSLSAIPPLALTACREKSELVDLIMQSSASSNSTTLNNSSHSSPHSSPSNCGDISPSRSQHSSPPHWLNCDGLSQQRPPANMSSGSWSAQNSPIHPRRSVSPETSASHDDVRACRNTESHAPSSSFAEASRLNEYPSTISIDSETASETGGVRSVAVTVEDIQSEADIPQLSVRQLKLILTRSYVDYRGCVEKSELQGRVQRLWRQHQEFSQDVDKIQDENLCKICMEAAIDSVLLECGHMVTCTKCGKHLAECPVCRQFVVRVVHTFHA